MLELAHSGAIGSCYLRSMFVGKCCTLGIHGRTQSRSFSSAARSHCCHAVVMFAMGSTVCRWFRFSFPAGWSKRLHRLLSCFGHPPSHVSGSAFVRKGVMKTGLAEVGLVTWLL